MKNLILITLTVFACTFSFSQSADLKENEKQLKENCVEVSNYLSGELKLDTKEKAILSNAFAEYANNISKMNIKLASKSNMSKEQKNKMTFEKMAEFTKIRDGKISKLLNEREVEMYGKLSKHFDQMTLSMKKKKNKRK